MKRVVATLMLSLLVVATAQAAPPAQQPVPYVSNEEASARLVRACRTGPQACDEYTYLLSYCHGMRGIAITAASMRDKIGRYDDVVYIASSGQRRVGRFSQFYVEPEHVKQIVSMAFESGQSADELSARIFHGCLLAWDDR